MVNGTLNLKGGTISGLREIRYGIKTVAVDDAAFTMTGGNITALNETDEADVYGVYVASGGSKNVVNITGGKIDVKGSNIKGEADYTSAVYLYGPTDCTIGGNAVISASNIDSEGAYAVQVSDNKEHRTVKVLINGGEFSGALDDYKAFEITGGTFSDDVMLGVKDGYECISSDGKFTVQEIPAGTYIASIGSENYTSLSEALSDVPQDNSETTITLLRSTKETMEIKNGQNVVLNLGDNSVYSIDPHDVANGASLTVNAGTGGLYGYGEGLKTSGTLVVNSGIISSTVSSESRFLIVNNGNMEINGGKLSAYASGICNYGDLSISGGEINLNYHNFSYAIANYNTLNMTGGTVRNEKNSAIIGYASDTYPNASIKIRGASIYALEAAIELQKEDYETVQKQTLEITDTVISGKGPLLVADDSANVTIYSGEFESDKNGYLIENEGGSITIKDGKFTGLSGSTGIINHTGGTLIIEDGTFSGEGNKGFINMEGGAAATILNAEVTSTGRGMGVTLSDKYGIEEAPNITIENETFNTNDILFKNDSSGTITIKNGNYSAKELFRNSSEESVINIENGIFVSQEKMFYASDGVFNVSGGTFTTDDTLIYINYGEVNIENGIFTANTIIDTSNMVRGNIEISDGEFEAAKLYGGYNPDKDPSLVTDNTKVSGGSFNVDVNPVLSEGFYTEENEGIYSVIQKFTIQDFDTQGKSAVINNGSESETVTVIFAILDSEEKLVNAEVKECSLEAGQNNIGTELDLSTGSRIRIFIWNNMTELIPLCGSYTENLDTV